MSIVEKTKLDKLVSEAAELNNQIKKMSELLDSKKKLIREQMNLNQQDKVTVQGWTCTKTKRIISEVVPDLYKKYVTEEDFMNSIKVSVTQAKEYLPKTVWKDVIVQTEGSEVLTFRAIK